MITEFRGNAESLNNHVGMLGKFEPAYYDREHEKIFRRSWLPIAFDGDVPERGSYTVVDMPTFKTSLLVMRGEDGIVRAFHNMCTHRGNMLVRSGSGCKSRLICGYHGWSYDTNGTLATVTDEAQFRNLDPSTRNLVPVATETWEGYVFVNFEPTPRETLREWLGVWYDLYGGYFGGREKLSNYRIVVNANWNLAINAFTEGYHSLFVHRSTLPDYQGGKANPLRHRPYLELMQKHAKYSGQRNPNHRPTPTEAASHRHGHKLFPAFDVDASHVPAGVNPSRYEQWAFDLTELFPNFVFLTGAHWHVNIWFWPLDATHTVIQTDAYADKAKNAGECLGQAYFKVRNREVLREDVNVMESVQRMLLSGALNDIVLSEQEKILQHHYSVAEQMMSAP